MSWSFDATNSNFESALAMQRISFQRVINTAIRFVEKLHNPTCESDTQCFEGLICQDYKCMCQFNGTYYINSGRTIGCTHCKLS